MEITCQNCQQIFTDYPSTPRKYCSTKCYGEAQHKGTTTHTRSNPGKGTCEYCKQEFQRKRKPTQHNHGRFCSTPCARRWAGEDRIKRHQGGNRRELEYLHNRRRKGEIKIPCEACGFDRFVEICHIIPASKGGKHSKENIIWMCPNHHKLFERLQLTTEELERLPKHAQDAYHSKIVTPLPTGPKPRTKQTTLPLPPP